MTMIMWMVTCPMKMICGNLVFMIDDVELIYTSSEKDLPLSFGHHQNQPFLDPDM